MLDDFNFNLLRETSGKRQYLHITDGFNFAQLVNEPNNTNR